MRIKGKVIKYGTGINTDVIIPSKYLVYTDPRDLAKYAMSGIDSDFPKKVKDRNIIVAGKNFGCGSSREQAPVALKFAGIKCVLSDSFARIFYRNAINIGLPILEYGGISAIVKDGDDLEIDFKTGIITDTTLKIELSAKPLPDFLMNIMEKGLVNYIKEGRRISRSQK